MRIQSTSFAFTLLLGLLSAVPYSGIDINLPALSATAATLGVCASEVGLTMSAFVLSLAVMPLIYGPASDRFGRKPIVLFGILLFVMGSVACALASSLPTLLACRVIQGIGAAAMGITLAIIRDLFDGNAARIKIANVMVAVNVATMVSPTAGAALLMLGNWRLIYAVQAGIGLILLLAVLFGLSESARINPTLRSGPAAVSSYLRVLTNPVSFGFVLVGAAAACGIIALWGPLAVEMWVRVAGSAALIVVVVVGYLMPARGYLARSGLSPEARRFTLWRMLLAAGLSGVPLLGTWAGLMWMYQWVGKLPGGEDKDAKAVLQMWSSVAAAVRWRSRSASPCTRSAR